MAEILLRGGGVTLVSEEDYESLATSAWNLNANGYVVRGPQTEGRQRRMHRAVMELSGFSVQGLDVDHKNRNKLDNRRENLRLATRAENLRNTGPRANNRSGLKGVRWVAAMKKWEARISANYKVEILGWFKTSEEAYEAYKVAALRLHGEFARF